MLQSGLLANSLPPFSAVRLGVINFYCKGPLQMALLLLHLRSLIPGFCARCPLASCCSDSVFRVFRRRHLLSSWPLGNNSMYVEVAEIIIVEDLTFPRGTGLVGQAFDRVALLSQHLATTSA